MKKVKQIVEQTKGATRSSRSAPKLYLVETGESRTLPETTLCFV